MKARKILSGMLLGFGCALTFIGFLALILPKVDNAQLKLVLSSFRVPSSNTIVALINKGMNYALNNGWPVVGVGAVTLLIGGLLVGHFSTETIQKKNDTAYRRPIEAEQSPAPVASHVENGQINPFASFYETDEDNPFRSYAAEDFAPQERWAGCAVEPKEEKQSSYSPYARPLDEASSSQQPVSVFSAPRYSPTLENETRAMAYASGDISPSGAQTIVRTPPAEEPASEVVKEEGSAAMPVVSRTAPMYAEPEEATVQIDLTASAAPVSSRIRSTMGRHRSW